jgi:NADH dehydrogenase FAD-containing subunit
MKIALQYVSDSNGTPKSVQLPIAEWEKVLSKLKKYEQSLKIKTDLKEAFDQAAQLRKSKAKKQTLTKFLNEL